MNKQLKDFTVLELKAMKADIYESNQANVNNLNIINEELNRRNKEAQKKPKMEEETKVEGTEEVVETVVEETPTETPTETTEEVA